MQDATTPQLAGEDAPHIEADSIPDAGDSSRPDSPELGMMDALDRIADSLGDHHAILGVQWRFNAGAVERFREVAEILPSIVRRLEALESTVADLTRALQAATAFVASAREGRADV